MRPAQRLARTALHFSRSDVPAIFPHSAVFQHIACYSRCSLSTEAASSSSPPSPASLTRTPANLTPSSFPASTAPRPNTLPRHVQIQQQKFPQRGGQNLTSRWRRLERSLRGKEAYGAQRQGLVDQAEGAGAVDVAGAGGKGKELRTFMGLVIPDKPKEPQSDECCMSGCAICVYDLYSAALDDYNRAISALQTALTARHIPEVNWPADIRSASQSPSQQNEKKESPRNVSMNAFEEFERQLRERKEREVQAGLGGSNGEAAYMQPWRRKMARKQALPGLVTGEVKREVEYNWLFLADVCRNLM
ncbi:hypothetical protein AcV7_001612 [Taiwanofungus camphoratus]|nr:hypothetical protein AcV7_001612 [Antrodia cinnamomea]